MFSFLNRFPIKFYSRRLQKNYYLELKRNNNNFLTKKNNTVKKVLVCMHSLDWGGAERFGIDTIIYLKENNIDYHLFIEKKSEVLDFVLIVGDVNITYADNYQNSPYQLLELIECYQPDILHINHSYSAYKSLEFISRSLFILDTLHIIEYQSGGYPYLSAQKSKYINMHHVVSNELKVFLHKNLGVWNHKIYLGYLTSRSSRLLKKNRIYGKENIVIGFIGRFERQKRPELFIEIARKLNQNIFDCQIQYIMKGEGSLKEKCLDLIEKYRILNIQVLNPDENIDIFHDWVDVVVNTSENEGLALIGLECAKKHTVIISANVGQQKEIICTKCLVPADPKKFINAVCEIILDFIHNPSHMEDVISEQIDKWNELHKMNERNNIWDRVYKNVKSQ